MSDSPELKGGHAPAVKAGGMRITQNKPPAQDEPEPMTSAEKEEFPEEKPEKPGAVVLSGYRTKGDKDFQAEAVRVSHSKPQPQHDKRPPNKGAQAQRHNVGAHIQQPRKN
ncbi:death-associated protein 1 homolog [Oscarella lobularis]|uniref:death-associated protein 1 homolog n=1 Tax=Oscarella lobularis TaxID=121494 RepID=UPI0033138243